MTIQQAIDWLERVKAKYGGAVPVFFDCPHCGIAYTPDELAAESVHISGAPRSADEKKE